MPPLSSKVLGLDWEGKTHLFIGDIFLRVIAKAFHKKH